MANPLELEAELARNLDDPAACQVYADWLTERGDPRGELISLELAQERQGRPEVAARIAALHAAHAATWLGGLADNRACQVSWRRGFIREAVLGSDDDHDPDRTWRQRRVSPEQRAARRAGGGAPGAYAALRALPAAAQLRALTFGPFHDTDGEPSWEPATHALVAHGVPASLRALTYDRGSYWDISATHLGSLAPAYPQLAGLASLTIRLGHMDLGAIALPSLREFEVWTGGFTRANMRSVLAAAWPGLEKLTLRFGDVEDHGAECTIDDVAPLLTSTSLPRLTHLGLGNAPFADDLVALLARSPLLRQLTSLDLSLGTLSDAGVDVMRQHAAAFRHLARLDVSESFLGDGALARLRQLGPEILAGGQHTGGADDRYCSIGE